MVRGEALMFGESELAFDRHELAFEKFERQSGPGRGVVHAAKFIRDAKSPSVPGEKTTRGKQCPVFAYIEE